MRYVHAVSSPSRGLHAPPPPVPRPGRALLSGSRDFTCAAARSHPAVASVRPAPAHGLHVTPPRAFETSAAARKGCQESRSLRSAAALRQPPSPIRAPAAQPSAQTLRAPLSRRAAKAFSRRAPASTRRLLVATSAGSPTSASARLLDSARAIALDSSSQARPSRSPACAAAAPRAPNPDLALTQKAAQMENGITNSSISRRARRAAALGLNPSAALSPPRLRHRCAPRAQL